MNSITISYDILKPKAVSLRRKGRTFSEITTELGHIPKSTMSYWFKNIELTESQNERILKIRAKNGELGRHIGAQKSHLRRVERLKLIKNKATSEFAQFYDHKFFLAGLVLYLAEGSKKSEQFLFMNSDPKLITLMIEWIVKFSDLSIDDLKFRLYVHELYKGENCETFWKDELKIKDTQFLTTIYKPTGRRNKKNVDYKGCMRLEAPGSELYWKIIFWRDCFYDKLT